MASGGLNLDGFAEVEGRLHVLTRDPRSARLALEAAGMQICAEEQVVVVQMEDRPGVAARIFRTLAEGGMQRALHVHRVRQPRRDRDGGPAEDAGAPVLVVSRATLSGPKSLGKQLEVVSFQNNSSPPSIATSVQLPERRPSRRRRPAAILRLMHRSLLISAAVLIASSSLSAAEPEPSRDARWPGGAAPTARASSETGLPSSGAAPRTWPGRPRSPAAATPRPSCGATASS